MTSWPRSSFSFSHIFISPVATVLVLRGCLQPGSHIISGISHAKVRVMKDSSGGTVKTAYPGMAITVSGWKTLPNAGDEVLQGNEGEIKKAIINRQRRRVIESSLVDAEAINAARRHERETKDLDPIHISEPEPGLRQLRLVIKADVSGSAEAVVGALEGIGNKIAGTKVVSCGVGDVSESDIMLAKAVGGKSTPLGYPFSITKICHRRNDCGFLGVNTSANRNLSSSKRRPHMFLDYHLQIDG